MISLDRVSIVRAVNVLTANLRIPPVCTAGSARLLLLLPV